MMIILKRGCDLLNILFLNGNMKNISPLSFSYRSFNFGGGYYNETQKQMQDSVTKIVETHIDPYILQWEEEEKFPARSLFKLLGNAGFLGVNKPAEYGGSGLSYKYHLACMEALAAIRAPGVTLGLGVQTDVATPALARFGSDYLKKTFLTPSIKGDLIACLGVSEPDAGSDVANIKTYAKQVGDDLIISGQKMWITNGCQADWICLLANTNSKGGHKNKSLICVPMDTPGVHVARNIRKLGMRCSDTAHIFFDDVRVPVKNIIGKEGSGFTYQMLQFQEERLGMAVLSLVPAQMCIKETIEYTQHRVVFGHPVLDNQVVQFRLAELQTEIECLRALVYRAADLIEAGQDATYLATVCKLKSGRLAREVTDSCLQYWGGMGYTNEVLPTRLYRDLRLGSIGGGADEVMLSILCKFMQTMMSPI